MGRAPSTGSGDCRPRLSPGRRPAASPSRSPGFVARLFRARRRAAGLLAALGLLAFAGPALLAAPASAAVLVSNVGQTSAAGLDLANWDVAQGFTTGSHAAGYRLTSVEVSLAGTPSGVSVKLATTTLTGFVIVATLTNPSTLVTGVNTFAAPAGTPLSPGTTYWVVVEGSGGSVNRTAANAEDSGAAAGWSIWDNPYRRAASSTGRVMPFGVGAWQVRINGEARGSDHGVPVAPAVAPTVSKTDGTDLGVIWAAPADTTPAITGYDVQYRRKGAAAWTDHAHTGTTVTTTVTGVVRGASWEARVRARNADGAGAWSPKGAGHTGPARFVSATTTSDGSRVVISFTKGIQTSGGGPAYSVTVAGTARTGTVFWDANDVHIRLDAAHKVQHGETVTVSYTKPATFSLRDTDNLEVASFSGESVTNAVSNTPAAVEKATTNAAGNRVFITFTKNVNNDAQASVADLITLTVGGTNRRATANFVSNSPVVTLSQFSPAITAGQTVTVSYTIPTTANIRIKDADGLEVANFSGESVTNAVTPAFQSAATPGGETVIVTFAGNLKGPAPDPGKFTVTAAGADYTPDAVRLGSDTLNLSLSGGRRFPAGAMTVSYDKDAGSGSRLIGANGEEIASFTGETVTSLVGVTVTGRAILSDPGADNTYQLGDRIRVALTFSEPVTVTGTPHILMHFTNDGTVTTQRNKQAGYESGSGTAEIVFAWTVASGDSSGTSMPGLVVPADAVRLAGGTIRSVAGNVDAVLDYVFFAGGARHLVDGSASPPDLTPAPVTGPVLVSNTGQDDAIADVAFTIDTAQAFTTGSHLGTYWLTGVSVNVVHTSGTPSYTVKIHEDSGGSPGNSLGTLRNPALTAGVAQNARHRAPGNGIVLEREKKYWVVTDSGSAHATTSFRRTFATAEDAGSAAGWRIADTMNWRNWNSSGAWTGAGAKTRIAIHGYARQPEAVPAAPAAPTVSTTAGTVLTVSWAAPASGTASGYDLRYRSKGDGAWTEHPHEGNAVTATINGVVQGASYEAQVRAGNVAGKSDWSASGSGHTGVARFVSAVTSSTGNAVEITFTKAISVAGDAGAHSVFAGGPRLTGATATIAGPTVVLNFQTNPIQAGQTVTISYNRPPGVAAKLTDADGLLLGNYSLQTVTNLVGALVPAAPSAPVVDAVPGRGALAVRWTAPGDGGFPITDYDLRYFAGSADPAADADWIEAAEAGGHDHVGTATAATIAGLEGSSSYRVQVRASNAKGAGAWSPSAGASTANAAPAAPAAPTVRAVSKKADRLFVSWTAPHDGGEAVTDYDLRYFQGSADPADEADWVLEHETDGLPGTCSRARTARRFSKAPRGAPANTAARWSPAPRASTTTTPTPPPGPPGRTRTG